MLRVGNERWDHLRRCETTEVEDIPINVACGMDRLDRQNDQ